jgi:two-component system catabolic regulation response regulator CreB
VKSILKRARPARPETPAPRRLQYGPFAVEEDLARITYHGTPLTLTRYEYLLLAHLVAHPERVHSRPQLLEQVWGSAQTSLERTVDAHVKAIRHKLRAVAPDEDPIETHRGFGYRLTAKP